MNHQSFTTTITIANSPKEVFNHILQVPKWWTIDFEGSNAALNDEFVINHPGSHYSKQKVVELIPNEKIVWQVTESHLNWLTKNKGEWTGTKMIFEISREGGSTVLIFTHDGLIPELECYERVSQGWGLVINKQLYDFINLNKTI